MIRRASVGLHGGLHFCPNGRWECENGNAPIFLRLFSSFLLLLLLPSFFFSYLLLDAYWCCNLAK